MKILVINKLYAPWVGGIEQVVQDIAEGLSTRHNITVLVCQPRGRGLREIINGIEVIRAGSVGMISGMPFSLSFFWRFYHLSRKADVIHIHFPFPLSALAAVFLTGKRKLVITWHSDIVRQRILRALLMPVISRALNKADVIIATSQRLSETTHALSSFKGKCTVIPLGIAIDRYIQGAEQFPLPFFRNTERIILFVGRLVYYKGLSILLEAMKTINAKLLIVGDGPLRYVLERTVCDSHMADKVFFLGKLSDSHLKYCFQCCDIFVLPSIAPSEAFGIVQLEAMAWGKPVVNTDLPTGVPWVSQHGVSGLTVPPKDAVALADALTMLLNDRELCQRLAQGARERAALFTKEQMVERYHQAFIRCAEGKQ